MNRKLIVVLLSLLFVGFMGCKEGKEDGVDTLETESKFSISNGFAELKGEDLEVVEWLYSAKEPSNPDKNNSNFIGDVIMGVKDNMSKKSVNINLREGQSLRIETDINSPITVMLKDNSNEKYIFNKTLVPVNTNILVDSVKKDGQYELTIDFNDVDEFKFKVYIVNKK